MDIFLEHVGSMSSLVLDPLKISEAVSLEPPETLVSRFNRALQMHEKDITTDLLELKKGSIIRKYKDLPEDYLFLVDKFCQVVTVHRLVFA